jgi:hypothetical protein
MNSPNINQDNWLNAEVSFKFDELRFSCYFKASQRTEMEFGQNESQRRDTKEIKHRKHSALKSGRSGTEHNLFLAMM